MNKIRQIKRKLLSIKLPNGRKLIKIILISTVILFLLITLILGGIQSYKLSKVGTKLNEIGNELHSSYHREFNLIERLNLVDTQEFKKDCEKYSNKCLYNGNNLRREFLDKITSRSFTDDEIAILNMISSVNVSIRESSDMYNTSVTEYNNEFGKYPLNILRLVIKQKELLK